jgi:hypothetical protein
MITADQLLLHAIGDYLLQSHWMATTKISKSIAALAHVVTYTLPFLILTTSWKALVVIAGTHFFIDRFRLARYVCWAKNFLGPGNESWSKCSLTGYPSNTPTWLAVWLMIITDNIMHVICNGLALHYL